uniref:Uncharacterized protein n=2 Tax=Triticum TaxID=4564 RepID=A0A8R7UIS2_TRIUA
MDCLNWRLQNEIDSVLAVIAFYRQQSLVFFIVVQHCSTTIVLAYVIPLTSNHHFISMQKPILPADLYRSIRDTLLVGLTGY